MAGASELDQLWSTLQRSNATSLLKRFLTADVFASLRSVRTATGSTLADVMRSGVKNLDSGIGVYAPDWQSYESFAPLFDAVIRDYHGFSRSSGQKHPPMSLNPEQLRNADSRHLDPEARFIVSTRIRAARNLESFALGGTISDQDRLELERQVVGVLNTLDGDLAGTYYGLSGMSAETQEQLIQDHFLFQKGDRFMEEAGLNRDWPNGRGIFHNASKTFLVWINEEDQLRIISMEQGADVLSVFTRLCAALRAISSSLSFAWSDRLGSLSSCPTNLGTGIRASVHVRLPRISTSKGDQFKAFCKSLGVQARGVHGEHSESSECGIFDISNLARLGLNEVACVQQMVDGVRKLIQLERELEEQEATLLFGF